MSSENSVLINGNEFPFETDDTILDVAQRNSIDIPTLCHLKGATPTGACRMCVVEVKGARSLVAACSAPVAPGMEVQTETPKIIEARRMVLQLLLSSGNHNCAVSGSTADNWTEFQLNVIESEEDTELCPVWGDCRLQDLAFRYQVTGERFEPSKTEYAMETANPFIMRDFSRCIQCGRCVQACNEVQVNQAIHFGYRGAATKIIAAGDRPYINSDCVFCGECVQACPVGALVEKDARYEARPWETRKVRTTCSYCGVGCQLYLHVRENRVVKVSGVEEVAPNYGSLCVKGRFGFDFIHSPDRLKAPLIRENGALREASWDEALDLVARRLGDIKAEHGPDTIGFLTSARITNEENYIAQKFARAVVQTNNVDHCARL
jgi:predicted molibdopterin-dependent oxidoreductase YjgC